MTAKRTRWRYRGTDPVTRLVTQLANETGRTPEQVAADLDQALDAGLLRWTADGQLVAVVPEADAK